MDTQHRIFWREVIPTLFGLVLVAALLGGKPAPAAAAADTVFIPARDGWAATGIVLAQGQQVQIKANGQAITGKISQYPAAKSGPGGQLWNLGCGQYEGAPPPCALDDAPYGALLGRIGLDGEAFLIGDAPLFAAPAAGELFLAVNDNLDYYDDNRGGFNAIFQWHAPGRPLAAQYIIAYPDWNLVEGHHWKAGTEVTLRVYEGLSGLVYEQVGIAEPLEHDPDDTLVAFDLNGVLDIYAGQRIQMTGGSITRDLLVSPIAVSGYAVQGGTISGTCDPAVACWAHMDDRDPFDIRLDGSAFTAYFEYLIPWEEGWAFQWDADGDETRVRFSVNTDDARMIAAYPNEDFIEGGYWKVGQEVTVQVFGLDGELVYAGTRTPEADEGQPGGSYFKVDLSGSLDVVPGMKIAMTNGTLSRELVVSPVQVTGIDTAAGTISGICDPLLFCWTHTDSEDFTDFQMEEDGRWTAAFASLTSGQTGWAFQWEDDGDETRVIFSVP